MEKEQLPLLLPFLERKIKTENSREPALYNALAKIYIITKQDADRFLRENSLYDSKIIGQFCESYEPALALIAYEKGRHDKELIEMTNRQSMFKEQARYLLSRRDANLWKSVLLSSNPNRRNLMEALINSTVIESSDAEDVAFTVKALMIADLPTELIGLLEKIVYGDYTFSQHRNLQNLLINRSIKICPRKVMDHLQRLQNYDGAEVAVTCAQAGLFEEAFVAFKKAGNQSAAMAVLIDNIKDYERSLAFAEDCNDRKVWKALGVGMRKAGKIGPSIEAYLRADDASDYVELIRVAGGAAQYAEGMLQYLQMARKNNRDPIIDNEIIFALATLHRLADMEQFLAHAHAGQLQVVADRCFQAQLWEPCKLLLSSVNNHAKLAITLVHLCDYKGAVESAKRANSLKVWADVHMACLETNEFSLAQVCGLHLIVHADELDGLVYAYESRGLYTQCLTLLEGSLGLERAPVVLYTELAMQYARHAPEKLSDFIKRYGAKLNVPKLSANCSDAHLWPELALLLTTSGEYARAHSVMLDHPMAWNHDLMCSVLVNVASPDTVLRTVKFYLEEAPMQLNDLLVRVGTRVDPTRIVEMLRKEQVLPLCKGYLVAVQPLHNAAVNMALNELLLIEDDLEGLKTSLAVSDKFDAPALAKKLAQHDRLEIRRLAAQLYRTNRLWRDAVAILLEEGLHRDAIVMAAEARERAVSEDLLRNLADCKQPILFLACCYACADSLPSDVVIECAWKNEWMDIAMPVMCQAIRDVLDAKEGGVGTRTGSRLSFASGS